MARRRRIDAPPPESFDRNGILAAVTASDAYALFDHLPDAYLYVKDCHSRFVKVNEALWRLEGCTDEAGMLGRTDFDFHPPALAGQYIDEDRRVMAGGKPLPDQLWLVPAADGVPLWYLSSKRPLRNATGEVIGIAGVMRRAEHAGVAPREYARLAPVLDAVTSGYSRPLTIGTLARRAGLSVSQLQREFTRLLHQTPSEYIVRVRVLMARRLLERTTQALGKIALDCGFYDQSHFTRTFRTQTGMAPSDYRKRFAAR